MSAIDAGEFGAWLAQFRAALKGNGGTDVPCGDCDGCCVSSYSILVRPDDAAALTAIPAELLTGTPSLGPGMKAMGYRPNGRCPMLVGNRCSIYQSRPQTCRDYDCRVFAAAGIDAGKDKHVINRRVHAWQFSYASDSARLAHRAVQAAAAFIRSHHAAFPTGTMPSNASGIAVTATKVYDVFLLRDHRTDPTDIATAVLNSCKQFDSPPHPVG